MTTDFRAMCAELVAALDNLLALVNGECPSLLDGDRGGSGFLDIEIDDALTTARDLLAQPVPEGRSSDSGYEAGSMWAGHPILTFPAVPDGREPASVATQPSDGEAAELSRWLAFEAENALAAGRYFPASMLTGASELLARWGHPTPQPVAVSERLPGPEDVNEDGNCWLWDREGCFWGWTYIRTRTRAEMYTYTHWLPANALPTPEATND